MSENVDGNPKRSSRSASYTYVFCSTEKRAYEEAASDTMCITVFVNTKIKNAPEASCDVAVCVSSKVLRLQSGCSNTYFAGRRSRW